MCTVISASFSYSMCGKSVRRLLSGPMQSRLWPSEPYRTSFCVFAMFGRKWGISQYTRAKEFLEAVRQRAANRGPVNPMQPFQVGDGLSTRSVWDACTTVIEGLSFQVDSAGRCCVRNQCHSGCFASWCPEIHPTAATSGQRKPRSID